MHPTKLLLGCRRSGHLTIIIGIGIGGGYMGRALIWSAAARDVYAVNNGTNGLFLCRLELLPLEDPDMDVDELLRCVCDADSAQEVERCGSLLVQHLRLNVWNKKRCRRESAVQASLLIRLEGSGGLEPEELFNLQQKHQQLPRQTAKTTTLKPDQNHTI
ncbi:hypothetical protein EYF80_002520 [Liparis tanakae]|uniref:Uncharacterized protein n=1 Tax=Liparis tanakae TaxID=230148 RepID=A0A4Z2JCI0_9TELE|nr:hypothetical protein EYF80_002520 [Liparis tanakae]